MKSVKMKLIAGISSIIIFFVLMAMALNNFFLLKLYVYKNKINLKKIAEELEITKERNRDKLFVTERKNGIFIVIFDKELKVIHPEIDNEHKPRMDMPDASFFKKEPERFGSKEMPPMMREKEEKRRMEFPADRRKMEFPVELLKNNINKLENKKYIYLSHNEEFRKISFIDMLYKCADGSYFLISKPYETISESSQIAISFFIISGIVAVIIGIIYAYIFAGRIVKPILEINRSAREISKLNFEHRCEVYGKDEISQLADSINIMSDKLSGFIEELKIKNKLLEKEIENEKKMEMGRKEFISNVSHELKTPISLISGYAEGLKYSVVDNLEEKESYCDVIIDESARMDKLIKELLELSAIESPTYKLNKKEYNISELVEKIFNKYMIIFKENEITAEKNIEKDIIVMGDGFRIEQVISNFIDNAVKNCCADKKIMVELIKKEEKIVVSVYNTGRGISDIVKDRIWESFYKEDESRKRENGGVGLGLAIVSAILQKHNYEYGFKNLEDGVKFYFTINNEA